MKLFKIQNKKGEFMLAGHVINLLLAAICIIFLVGIAVYLLWMFVFSNNKAEQAKANLDMIIERVGDLKEPFSIRIESPENWVVVAWPNNKRYAKPFGCKMRSEADYEIQCLCICEDTAAYTEWAKSEWEDLEKNCGSKRYGYCRDLDIKVEIKGDKILIRGITDLGFKLEKDVLIIEKT